MKKDLTSKETKKLLERYRALSKIARYICDKIIKTMQNGEKLEQELINEYNDFVKEKKELFAKMGYDEKDE